MLDRLSSVRDSTVLFSIGLAGAIIAAVFAVTIGPEFATVPVVLTVGTVVFGALRRRDGD